MSQIINPNYYNPQYRNPMYGQYIPQNFQQPAEQFQQQPQYVTIQQQMYGRIVPSVDNIAPNEVPMDGNMAFFPKQDMSEIYVKSWGADGKIYTRLYKPVLDADPNNPPSDTEKAKFDLSDEATAVFMKRFDELEQKIEQLKSSQTQRKSSQTQRKDDLE